MSNAIHICSFAGERLPPIEAEQPFVAKKIGKLEDGRLGWVEVLVTPKAPKQPRCDFETSKGRCTKTSAGGARFPWGCVALCPKHLDEECGPIGGTP